MSKHILPRPRTRPDTDTPPTPTQIRATLAALNAVETTPGVWTARLSNGYTLRVTVSPTTGEASHDGR